MKIAIAGRKADTENYVAYVSRQGHTPLVTLELSEIARCGCLILPGGGDITPAFFGEKNRGSRNVDTELDILQLQAFDLCVERRLPVLGICKGLQLINIGLGGTLYQDMPTARLHRWESGDQYHETLVEKGSWLHGLYGDRALVNSAHHQALGAAGTGLRVTARSADGVAEAAEHESLPVMGVQFHPERMCFAKARPDTVDGAVLFAWLKNVL